MGVRQIVSSEEEPSCGPAWRLVSTDLYLNPWQPEQPQVDLSAVLPARATLLCCPANEDYKSSKVPKFWSQLAVEHRGSDGTTVRSMRLVVPCSTLTAQPNTTSEPRRDLKPGYLRALLPLSAVGPLLDAVKQLKGEPGSPLPYTSEILGTPLGPCVDLNVNVGVGAPGSDSYIPARYEYTNAKGRPVTVEGYQRIAKRLAKLHGRRWAAVGDLEVSVSVGTPMCGNQPDWCQPDTCLSVKMLSFRELEDERELRSIHRWYMAAGISV